MPLSTIIVIGLVIAFASAVNGYLGAGFCLFMLVVLRGMINDSIRYPDVRITQYTWTPYLLLPLAIFLIVWQWRLRGRIGPRWGLRDLMRRRSSYA
jgi:hypothetical protein